MDEWTLTAHPAWPGLLLSGSLPGVPSQSPDCACVWQVRDDTVVHVWKWWWPVAQEAALAAAPAAPDAASTSSPAESGAVLSSWWQEAIRQLSAASRQLHGGAGQLAHAARSLRQASQAGSGGNMQPAAQQVCPQSTEAGSYWPSCIRLRHWVCRWPESCCAP